MIAGVNWNISRDSKGKPAVRTQLQWERKTPEASGSDPTDYVMLQLQWNFSNTLK
jgi:hypothetical protein